MNLFQNGATILLKLNYFYYLHFFLFLWRYLEGTIEKNLITGQKIFDDYY